jgi:NAD+ synthase
VVLFTELFIAGYPPEDLVLKPAFLKACLKAVEGSCAETADGGPAVIIGYPRTDGGKRYNSVAVLDGGKLVTSRDKVDLPNYGEFDEKRVFHVGEMPGPVAIRGVRIGIPVCEDIWGDLGVCETLSRKRRGNPAGAQRFALLSRQGRYPAPGGSPPGDRKRPADDLCQPGRRPGRTGLRWRQLRHERRQEPGFQMSQFEETVSIVTFKRQADGQWTCSNGPVSVIPDREEADYRACMLGCGITSTRTASAMSCWGFRAASIRRSARRSPSMRWARSGLRTVMLPYRYTSRKLIHRRRGLRPGARLPL